MYVIVMDGSPETHARPIRNRMRVGPCALNLRCLARVVIAVYEYYAIQLNRRRISLRDACDFVNRENSIYLQYNRENETRYHHAGRSEKLAVEDSSSY